MSAGLKGVETSGFSRHAITTDESLFQKPNRRTSIRTKGPTIFKGGNIMIKAGDMFKNIESGKMFAVKSIDPIVVILGTKDGSHSMFVSPKSLESLFLPFVEEEVKPNLK